ncbi:hypothetical protein JCM8097_003992 [Rhodosporidiobolus ruineniae]
MSLIGGLNLTSIISAIPSGDSTAWIAPWVEQVLNGVQAGQNPYERAVDVIQRVYYPDVVSGFKPQLWFLMGLFGASILIILLGLVLRLRQGRFWLLHRIDKTILIPNISTIYGLCALVYAALGMLTIVTAVRVADREHFPSYWVGLQAGWVLPLWLGFYTECWATFCAWYIRKKGAFYKESWFKTIVAVTLPFFLPLLAVIPPVALFYIAAHQFNSAFRTSLVMIDKLEGLVPTYDPAKGIDLISLLSFFPLGSEFGGGMVKYFRYVRAGYAYVTVALAVTFVVYIIGSFLEVAHLNKTIQKLRDQAKLTPRVRNAQTFTAPTPQIDAKLDEQLEDEMYAGQRRQWTLLEWARNNRIYSAFAIGLMLLVNAALAAWLSATPISIEANSAQFQVEILVSCWLNGILSTVVSLLILFRSLDGSSPTVATLRRFFPFLPLPPAICRIHPSRATSTMNPKTTISKLDEPPKYGAAAGGFGRGGASSPIMEERKTPRMPGSPGESFSLEDGTMGDKAWYGLGVTAGGRDEQGLHVVLEMQQVAHVVRYLAPDARETLEIEAQLPPTPNEEKDVEFEEPPRPGSSGFDDHLDELPYQEHHFAPSESEAEQGFDSGMVRQDSWAAAVSGARRDSWD